MVTRRLLAALLLGLACVTAAAENLETAVQQQVLGATFEVVQLKPAEGAVTYERELPLDLLPYQQRIDKYRSVGTAFAIAPNHYITAGHVLAAGQDSQFGPPALRDAAGNVYEIDEVLKYSDDQDFVEFSLKKAPPQEKFLAVATSPPLNETVFAVGNALGEGVVIRDGVFTSETPEEASGSLEMAAFQRCRVARQQRRPVGRSRRQGHRHRVAQVRLREPERGGADVAGRGGPGFEGYG